MSEMARDNKTEEEQLTLDEAFAQLDEVLALLQNQETPLEEAFTAYQKGVELVRCAEGKIDLIEKQVMVLGEGGTLDAF